MKVSKEDFQWAASQELITPEQAEALWETLSERSKSRSQFSMANAAYSFGAAIVICAMGWFMLLAEEAFGSGGVCLTASFYILCFFLAGTILWYKKNLKVLGGLLVTIAVCLAPLATYSLQRWLGIWPLGNPGNYQDYYIWVKGSRFLLELATILAGAVALKAIPFPFLSAPITFSLWYMSMDLTPLLFGQIAFTWEQQLLVGLWFGLACLVVAYWVDLHTKRGQEDYAFWLYLFGLLSFWIALSLMGGDSDLQRFLYCLINGGLIVLSALLKRRVFLLFGGMGVLGYLSNLAYQIFQDSVFSPFTLTVVGIAIIFLGLLSQCRRPKIERLIFRLLPQRLRQILLKDN